MGTSGRMAPKSDPVRSPDLRRNFTLKYQSGVQREREDKSISNTAAATREIATLWHYFEGQVGKAK
jgi:hypothetical protein